MIQLIGYFSFAQTDEKIITKSDVEAGYRDAQEDMESMIFESSVIELSDADISFLISMLEDEKESRMADIVKRLNVSSSYASHYKRRLIERGIISETGRGKVEFNMPVFRDLLAKRYKIQ